MPDALSAVPATLRPPRQVSFLERWIYFHDDIINEIATLIPNGVAERKTLSHIFEQEPVAVVLTVIFFRCCSTRLEMPISQELR